MKVNTSEFNIKHHNIGTKNDQYYALIDDHDFIDEKGNPRVNNVNSACAKLIYGRKSKHITDKKAYFSYFIKCSPDKEAYNPIKLHTSIKDKKTNAFIDTVCKNKWSFIEVDQVVFDKYVEFLKTKNVRILKDINRSLK